MNGRGALAASFVLGVLLCLGFLGLGFFVTRGFVSFKAMDRVVTVKGLSEREVPADVAIWPIRFNVTGDDLALLYASVEQSNARVVEFLRGKGFGDAEISVSAPSIMDRDAQGYARDQGPRYRYTATSTLTVYSNQVDQVRAAMNDLVDLGKQGLALSGQNYEARTQFLFTKLNDLKPAMRRATRATRARGIATRRRRPSRSTATRSTRCALR